MSRSGRPPRLEEDKLHMRLHLLARGLILCGGATEVLLAHAVGAGNTFLPGGHVEPGEGLAAALCREVEEELGLRCRADAYLGAIEHEWPEGAATDYEINHVFLLEPAGGEWPAQPRSRESHLEFVWSPVGRLTEANLLPPPLQWLIPRYAAGDRTPWWAGRRPGSSNPAG